MALMVLIMVLIEKFIQGSPTELMHLSNGYIIIKKEPDMSKLDTMKVFFMNGAFKPEPKNHQFIFEGRISESGEYPIPNHFHLKDGDLFSYAVISGDQKFHQDRGLPIHEVTNKNRNWGYEVMKYQKPKMKGPTSLIAKENGEITWESTADKHEIFIRDKATAEFVLKTIVVGKNEFQVEGLKYSYRDFQFEVTVCKILDSITGSRSAPSSTKLIFRPPGLYEVVKVIIGLIFGGDPSHDDFNVKKGVFLGRLIEVNWSVKKGSLCIRVSNGLTFHNGEKDMLEFPGFRILIKKGAAKDIPDHLIDSSKECSDKIDKPVTKHEDAPTHGTQIENVELKSFHQIPNSVFKNTFNVGPNLVKSFVNIIKGHCSYASKLQPFIEQIGQELFLSFEPEDRSGIYVGMQIVHRVNYTLKCD